MALTRTATYALILTNLGIPAKVTDEPADDVDGEIEITGTKFTVQVGDNYLILGQEHDDESFTFYPARKKIDQIVKQFRTVTA